MTDSPLVNAFLFAALGIIVFVAALAILNRCLPCSLWKQILDERNLALAILAGSVSIGMALIIAAAMH